MPSLPPLYTGRGQAGWAPPSAAGRAAALDLLADPGVGVGCDHIRLMATRPEAYKVGLRDDYIPGPRRTRWV